MCIAFSALLLVHQFHEELDLGAVHPGLGVVVSNLEQESLHVGGLGEGHRGADALFEDVLHGSVLLFGHVQPGLSAVQQDGDQLALD